MHPRPHTAAWLCVLTAIVAFDAARAAAQQSADPLDRFAKTEAMVPMRDGVRLHTAVFVPKGVNVPLPFLLLRTPYGIDGWPRRAFPTYLADLVKDGYVFVFQDIRGRYRSEGRFVMSRPPRDRDDP